MISLVFLQVGEHFQDKRKRLDFSYLEDGMESRKRSLDEGCSMSQTSPEVKRPRVQYPIGVTPTEVGKVVKFFNDLQAITYTQS